jgi:hypothetical protein
MEIVFESKFYNTIYNDDGKGYTISFCCRFGAVGLCELVTPLGS